MLRAAGFLILGTRNFTKDGYLRAAKGFDNSCIERGLAGKTVMVTGANAGLGFAASEALAKTGCTLYMVCRDRSRGETAVSRVIEASNNKDVHLLICDISSLASIHALAQEYLASGRPLHVLINNAGVLRTERATSVDGHELNFATNTLGTFALTQQLGPALKASAPSRVIMVSSGGMLTQPLVVDDLQSELNKTFDGTVGYARDKRRQVVMAERFSELWNEAGVSVYSMHPGWAITDGAVAAMPKLFSTYGNKMRTPAQGVDTMVWLAAEDAAKLQPGAFYLDRHPQKKHLRFGGTAYAATDVDALWEKLQHMATAPPGTPAVPTTQPEPLQNV